MNDRNNNRYRNPNKWEIIHHRKNGLSIREISENCGISKSTVHYICHKYSEHGDVTNIKPSGRPRKVHDREVRTILRSHSIDPTKTARSLTAEFNLAKNAESQVSHETIKKILNNNGIYARKIPNKWRISDKNKKLRLLWAKEHKNWSSDDWSKIVFSDESMMQNYCGRKLIRLRRGSEIPSDKYLVRNKWDVKCMIWGFVTNDGIGTLKFIEENITGEVYKNTCPTCWMELRLISMIMLPLIGRILSKTVSKIMELKFLIGPHKAQI